MKHLIFTTVLTFLFLNGFSQIEVVQNGDTHVEKNMYVKKNLHVDQNLYVNKIIDKSNTSFGLNPSNGSTINALQLRTLKPGVSWAFIGTCSERFNAIHTVNLSYDRILQCGKGEGSGNAQVLNGSIKMVTGLNPIMYQTKDSNSVNRYGFNAEEVEKVVPSLVETDKETGMKSINVIEMVPLLVDAIKELQKEVNVLKSKIK